MHTRNYLTIATALAALLALEGCYSTPPYIRLWGGKGEAQQEQPQARTTSREQPDIVTGGEDVTFPDVAPKTHSATPAPAASAPPAEPMSNAQTASAAATPADMSTVTPTAPASTANGANAAGTAPNATAAAGQPAAAANQGETLSMQADALFAFGSDALAAAGKGKLDEIAARLTATPNAAISIVGHADRIGSAERNQQLSQSRADAVKNYLVEKGVSGAMIQTEGRGSSEPVVNCPGDKPTRKLIACLAANRRVEINIQSK